jgi:hypothetical protein
MLFIKATKPFKTKEQDFFERNKVTESVKFERALKEYCRLAKQQNRFNCYGVPGVSGIEEVSVQILKIVRFI